MNCCICGPVKNCGKYLKKVLENMSRIGSLFNEYKIVLFYDHSTDDSFRILKEYQLKDKNMIFYVNKSPTSKYRTHNIANARNKCLEYVKQHKDTFPYFIMMDTDDVNCKNVNLNVLESCLKREDWDGLSFNTNPHYYDIWGLSISPFCFSYNHFQNNFAYHKIIRDYVMHKLHMLKNDDELLECISSFNGFSIYRTEKFLNAYYDGTVRLDLFPKEFILAHANAQKSAILVYKDYGHIKGKYEDCEHRSFHRMASLYSNAKIKISRKVLFS
jgi:hypothetical protein